MMHECSPDNHYGVDTLEGPAWITNAVLESNRQNLIGNKPLYWLEKLTQINIQNLNNNALIQHIVGKGNLIPICRCLFSLDYGYYKKRKCGDFHLALND